VDAAAVAPSPRQGLSADKTTVGVLVGYGLKNGLNAGGGLRFGYTLPMGLYLGGTVVYHVGKAGGIEYAKSTDRTVVSYGNDIPYKRSAANSFYLGAEVGYDIDVGPLLIRPYVGGGLAGLMTTDEYPTKTVSTEKVTMPDGQKLPKDSYDWPGTGLVNTSWNPAVWPGLHASLVFMGGLYVGADARYVYVASRPAFHAASVFGTAGILW
jgi:hypothetical protein